MQNANPLKDQTELEGLPLYLPEQNAVLVGRITDEESEMSGMAAYYVHWRGGVYIGDYNEEDDAFTPVYSTGLDERMMSCQVKAFHEMDIEKELSSIGEALLDAYDFAETNGMPDKQAHVYALQHINDFTRSQTAEILNVSPSTVDSQRTSATEKADAALAFAATYTEKTEDKDEDEKKLLKT